MAIFLLLAAGCTRKISEKPFDTAQVASLTVYNIFLSTPRQPQAYELKNETSVVIPGEIVRDLLARARHDSERFWLRKGGLFAVLSLKDGTSRSVYVSVYGGIIEVDGTVGPFLFAEADRQLWEKTFEKGILEETFGPINLARKRAQELAALPGYIADIKARRNLVRATDVIASLGPEAASAVPDLIPLITYSERNARHNAIWALGCIGPAATSALPALESALPTLEGGTRCEAESSIKKIRALQ